MAEAKQLERQRQTLFAIEAYKKASKIAQGKDSACLETIFTLQMKSGSFKDAAVTAAALEAIAATQPTSLSPRPSAATPSSFRPQTKTKPIS
jgi:hypothetical protein